MKHKSLSLAIAACLVSLSTASHAEVIPLKLAPGLWEETRVTLVNGQDVQATMRKHQERMMARMTPEQRKIMQESMGQQGANGAALNCLTPAQVAKGVDVDELRRQMEKSAQGCKLNVMSANASGAKFSAVCSGPQGMTFKGNGEYTVNNSKEWRFKMVSDGKVTGPDGAPLPQGGDFHATQEVHARWKASSCGSVASRGNNDVAQGAD